MSAFSHGWDNYDNPDYGTTQCTWFNKNDDAKVGTFANESLIEVIDEILLGKTKND